MARRPPLVLLHGVTNSARIWDEVAPLLSDDYDLIVPTSTGHRGGPAKQGILTISGLVDEAEATMDQLGLTAAHLAGNSMGGWIAIELARRGRALSVCALSPAGCWTPGEQDETHATSTIRRARRLARIASPLAQVALRSARIRRHTLRAAALHGNRITPAQALEIVTWSAAPLRPTCSAPAKVWQGSPHSPVPSRWPGPPKTGSSRRQTTEPALSSSSPAPRTSSSRASATYP